MCAFITGRVGDCGVGDDEAAEANTKLTQDQKEWFKSHICMITDEHGINRPVEIWPNPNYFGDGHGHNHPNDIDMTIANAEYIKAVREYKCRDIRTNMKWIKKDPIKYDYLKKANKTHANFIREARNGIKKRYPAYQSVAIFFSKMPPEEIILLMKERATLYAKNNDIIIENFRLLKSTIIDITSSSIITTSIS